MCSYLKMIYRSGRIIHAFIISLLKLSITFPIYIYVSFFKLLFTNTLCWNWDTIMEYDLMLMNILTKRFKQGIKGNKRPKAWGILFGVIIQLTETNQIYYIKKTNNSAWYQLISNTRVIIRFQKVLKCHCLHSMSKKIFFLWVLSPAF